MTTKDTQKKLIFRDYQKEASRKLAEILIRDQFALDASDTGVGKTFTAIATLLEMEDEEGNIPPVGVVCRARAKTKWQDALDMFGISPLFVMSWEKARRKGNDFFHPLESSRKKVKAVSVRISDPSLIIFDEIHCAGGLKSLNSELVIGAARNPNVYLLGLSATPADSPLKMKALGFCCNFHKLQSDFWFWCRANGCVNGPFGGLLFKKGDRERVLNEIHESLFLSENPKGIRLRKKELMDMGQFPKAETFVELWDIPKSPPDWVKESLEEVDAAEDADYEKHGDNLSGAIMAIRDRQRAELLKIPSLIEEIKDRVNEGEWVISFIQFTRSIDLIEKKLLEDEEISFGILDGRGSKKNQEKVVGDFQKGAIQVLICQVDAGSESIDLHDTDGSRPRHVMVFPTYKAVTLIQVLGRATRSGTKSPVVQRIIYSAEGIEAKIARKIEGRLENLSLLTDGELTSEGML